MGKSRIWNYISFNFRIVLAVCLFGGIACWAKIKGTPPTYQKGSISEFLDKVKNKSTPLGTLKNSSQSEVTVHLLWATWCTYCDQTISALNNLKNDKKYESVSVDSYSFDNEIPSLENEKLKKMGLFKNYHVAIPFKDLPEDLVRFPVLIIESQKSKDLSVYSGFSPERFRLFTKKLDRTLNRTDSYEGE